MISHVERPTAERLTVTRDRLILRALVLASVLVGALASPRLHGQTTSPSDKKALAFDVASVKESPSLEQDGLFRQRPGRFTVSNLSLRWIIRYAFRLRDYEIVQAPAWAETRYSINATFADSSTDNDDVRAMLQRLLAERFALRAHREQRTLQMYVLMKARGDGLLGPKLTRSDIDCDKVAAERAGKQQSADGSSVPTCTMFETAWSIRGFTRTVSQLAQILDEIVGSPVADRTGLSGGFNFDVQWAKQGDAPIDPSHQTVESLASISTALEEQLGLRLASTKGPKDILVIDHVERPTPD